MIDADALAQGALEQEEVCGRLVGAWGRGVLGEDGRVDRRRLSRLVFDDPDKRKWLEAVVHPVVAARRNALMDAMQEDSATRAVVLDVPLLFEVGLDRMCDAIVYVDAPEADRAARAAKRGWNRDELARREKNQMALDKKRARADYVVCNTATEAECRSQVRDLFHRILATVR